eukprot:CAMPEP_0194081620 /NCGR_PEP_ID=MMETSP0149-20130528/7348_1 /TAXON_ID=122233 /ORGANISM="Chaetoceros debilis, Strain MM31A-1" /LENGTH=423 /DNA_ID=CAMNT_0038763565 /DNA_START=92 /DNA_END=1363 /DNA_ORIENTATION=-
MDPSNPNGMALPPGSGSKRTRRMRSIQVNAGSSKKKGKEPAQVAYKPNTGHLDTQNGTAAIFLVKTYDMVSTCDPRLAEWAEDGETFVVKDPEEFAKVIIPKYFDHSKFSSFSRQLNFYGFKKVPTKPVRAANNKENAKHVRFYNEKFKKNRKDLLSQIQRSTRGAGNASSQVQEVKALKERVSHLEADLMFMQSSFKNLEEQMRQVLSMQQQQNQQQQQQNGYQPNNQNTLGDTFSPGQGKDFGNGNGNGNGYQNMPNIDSRDTGSWSQDRRDQYSGRAPESFSGATESYPGATESFPGTTETFPGTTESFPGGDIEGKTAPTLAPHPNVKKIDPSVLPPPPPDAHQLRAASLLRGFSSEFSSYEAHLFENFIADPPESSGDVVMNDKCNIKRMESLQISKLGRVATSSEVLPPADTDITGL